METIEESDVGATSEARYDFNEAFQSKVAALCIRDTSFLQRTDNLVSPAYFENAAEGALVNLVQRYYLKFKKAPDGVTIAHLLSEDKKAKVIREELMPLVKVKLLELMRSDISDKDYAVDKVAEFARHQAVISAIEASVSHLDRRDFSKIEKVVRDALNVGANSDVAMYDYFEEVGARTSERKDIAAGLVPPEGISTGFPALDAHLYHRGWGKKELSVIMGAAKAGKSLALIDFARASSMGGHNTLYVTLELSAKIMAARADANIAGVTMDGLGEHILDVERKVAAIAARSGKLHIIEFPTGSFRVSDLRRLLERQKTKGIVYEMVCVDYADIMSPEIYTDSTTENSKSIYVGLRGLAFTENVAMLTATQTNRDGAKSTVAKAEHVAEDYNKIRIADIVISINKTDEESSAGQARLYFAASRNQAGHFTIRIKQDVEHMKFIAEVMGAE